MRKSIFCVLFIIQSSYIFGAISLEDILSLDVTTASKTQESVQKATSVISTITAEQIKISGARTLYEVLQTVPGFFPTTQATWTVTGVRGLVSDGTDHILYLVDGHKQNSILENGYQQLDTIPSLNKVKKIEIIRGPGSVLWGSSAAWGIVNIITKDGVGKNGDETQISVGYSSADMMKSINLLQGFNTEELSGFLSFTHWESKGYKHKDQPNVRFHWGSDTNNWPNLNQHNPSFEIYSKIAIKNKHKIKFNLTDMSVNYPWDSFGYSGEKKPGSELRTRKAYFDYTYTKKQSDELEFSYNLFADIHTQLRHPIEIQSGDVSASASRWIEDLTREESAVGFEASGIYKSLNHVLNFGAKWVQTKLGPNRSNRFDTSTNLPTNPDTTTTPPQEAVNVIGVLPGVDTNTSIYFQEKYSLTQKNIDLFFGVRADDNDYREDKLIFMPRAGIVYDGAEDLTIKYIVNTGYLRPNAVYSKSGGKFYRAPSKTIENVNVVSSSEEVVTQDLQFYLNGEKTNHLSLTFFHTKIKNYITWETVTDLGYRNMGDAQTSGFEIEGSSLVTNSLNLIGSLSYAKGKLLSTPTASKLPSHINSGVDQKLHYSVADQDGNWLNYPEFIYNLGFNYQFTDNQFFNLNLRGWKNMNIIPNYKDRTTDKLKNEKIKKLEGESYIDFTYYLQELYANSEISIAIKNVLDNQEDIGLAINNGTYSPRGRNLYVEYIYEF